MVQLAFVWVAAVALLQAAGSSAGVKVTAGERERSGQQRVRYTASWAVEITDGGDKAADIVARRHGYRNLGKVANFDNIYHFVLSDEERAPRDVPYTAKSSALWSERSVGFADQQYIRPVYKRSYRPPIDPRFREQWFLLNTGQYGQRYRNVDLNIEKVWIQGLTGCNVTVGIVDDGFEYVHPDLRNNYVPAVSYDFVDGDPDPISEMYDWHGTRCAGLVSAAKDGAACGVGVAYNAKFGGIRLLGAYTDLNEASSLSYANDVIDIYSNSWGPCDEGCVDGPLRLTELALRIGAQRGRGGKGSIFVWANGNGGPQDDCAADGYSTSIYTISVGAVGVTGEESYYDEQCSAKMVTAFVTDHEGYSAVTTTAIEELCVRGFGGTSSSCPMVAGTIALTLEANSNLTWRDVMYLVVFTSNPSLTTSSSYITNRAGLRVSRQFGFGVLDAEAMVARARHWTNVPPQLEHRRFPSPGSGRATRNRAVVVQYTYRGSITYLEHVVANLTLQSSGDEAERGDIGLELRSPSGTSSTLLTYRPLDDRNGHFYRWPFMSVAFWGENPSGTWRLTIRSQTFATRADFSNLIFQFYGTSVTPSSVARIPERCHSSCARGCAAAGSAYCDACVRLRNAYTMECIDRCPLGYTQRNGYCYNSSLPEPVCNSKILSLTSGSCEGAGYNGCCTEGKCDGTLTSSPFGLCYCDDICHALNDCCRDINVTNCTRKDLASAPMHYVTLPSSDNVDTVILPRADDGASSVIRIPIPLPIGSSLHTTVYVGTNGYLSFDKVFTDYESFEFPGMGDVTLLAPFFSDIDISKGTGRISYEVHTATQSQAIFTKINRIINEQMNTEFSGTWLLVAEWRNVPEFGRSQVITNTFQGIIITNFSSSYAVFIYKCEDLQYSASATIGFTALGVLFGNHRLNGYNARRIACINSGQSEWVNLVYKLTREDLQPTVPIELHNECELNVHNCEQECIDLPTYFVCSCYDGYALQRNGIHCFPYCSETFTDEVGEFNSPSWPERYPQNFQCEWIVNLSETLGGTDYVIVFRVDQSAYGMETNCSEEYIQFFDGVSVTAPSLGRFCGRNPPSPIGTTGLEARVVFRASEEHPDNLRGVRVTYSVTLLENECEERNGGCEHICVNSPYSYTCACESGYSLNTDGTSCSDIDECHDGSHGCDHVCTNLLGSFECSCEKDFVLDDNSRSCVPSCNGNFSNLNGSFQSPGWPVYYPELDFSCRWLIQMQEEDSYAIRFTTDDSAYGILGRNSCPTDYLAFYDGLTTEASSLGRFCFLNTPPDILTTSGRAMVVFQASSLPHSSSRRGARVSYEAIRLVDECLTDNGGCEQRCQDTPLAFDCLCGDGYTLNADGHSCDDVDECSTSANHCEHLCVNIDGSYHCDCREGFALNSDGRTCRVSCGGTYTASSGSFHTPGWPDYHPLDFRCEWLIQPTSATRDMSLSLTVDQDHFGIHGRPPCRTDYLEFHDGNTTNAPSLGRYCNLFTPDVQYPTTSQAMVVFQASRIPHLSSRVGAKVTYQLFELVNECDTDNGECEGACVNTRTSYECRCGDGYTLASDGHSCEDVDECSTGANHCEQLCVNIDGSYHCDCMEGFALNSDGRTCRVSCGGTYTASSGSFHTPGWPDYHPLDFRCEWLIRPINATRNMSLSLTVDQDHFGIHGRPPCRTDYLEFNDGNTTDAPSLGRYCNLFISDVHYTTTSQAMVVFQASTIPHLPSRVGAKVTYQLFRKVNECESDNCRCEGSCVDTLTSYECHCGNGYSLASDGFSCEDIDECLDSQATFCDGTCVNTNGSFYCTCGSSFRVGSDGRSCLPVCGGNVTSDRGSISTPGWPQFYPSLDFTCEWSVDACSNTIIEFVFVEPFGIRGSQPCTRDYVELFDDYRDSESVSSLGKFCSLQVPNSVSTSSNSATIVFQASSLPHSTDHFGFNITFTAIEKVNECEMDNGGCEQVCVDLPKLFSCGCDPGFTLAVNGRDCDDIDECSGSHNCEELCVNNAGAFHCACNNPDFVIATDGRSCVPGCGGRLTAPSGNFSTPGWPDFYHSIDYRCEWIINIENHTNAAIDIVFNEPFGIHGRNPCTTDYVEVLDGVGENVASLGRFCFLNTPDTVLTSSSQATVIFQASSLRHRPSRVGVSVTYTIVLFNVNECEDNNGGCEQVCADTARSYTCSCGDGYSLDSNGRGCTDIDECSSLFGGCEHTCVNTQGSFYCECREGFVLSSNGRTCSIDCGGRLTAMRGTFQSPGWPVGYPQLDFRCVWILDSIPTDRSIAFVINETAFGINDRSPCSREYVEFFNTADASGDSVGKYCSLVPPGPVVIASNGVRIVFQGRVNQNRPPQYVGVSIAYTLLENECATDNGGCEYTCTDTVFSYDCHCPDGYQLAPDEHACEDVDECVLGTHECAQLCNNTVGLYSCSCLQHFHLAPDGKSCIPECGDQFSSPNGTFWTPGWPHFYPELDFECEWTINVNSTHLVNGTRMVLQFVFNESAFGFGAQSNCDRDYMKFYDGTDNDAVLATKLCGNTVPTPFTISSTEARIEFRGSSVPHADGQAGARVNFYTIEQEYGPPPCSQNEVYDFSHSCRPVECGGTVYAMSGVLQPPNWPESSSDAILCQWSIVLPNAEMSVRLVVDEIDITPSRTTTCFWNYLLVFDSMAVDSGIPPPLMQRMCGSNPPTEHAIATGNVVHVWYRAGRPPNRGFSLLYSAI